MSARAWRSRPDYSRPARPVEDPDPHYLSPWGPWARPCAVEFPSENAEDRIRSILRVYDLAPWHIGVEIPWRPGDRARPRTAALGRAYTRRLRARRRRRT